MRNVKLGLRLLLKQPGFTLAAVAVLALGVGANTAIFSLVNAFLLKPLAIHNASELRGVFSRDNKKIDGFRSVAYPKYAELAAHNSTFSSVLAHNLAMVGLTEGDTTRRMFTEIVSANFFTTLGVPLYRGRTFTDDEARPGAGQPVAIVSYSFWQRNGADANLIGKTLRVNGKLYTVVGITPEGFTSTTAMISPELYFPLGMYESLINDFEGQPRPLSAHDNYALILIGRLRPGVTQTVADAQLASLVAPSDDHTFIARPLSRLSVSDAPQSEGDLTVPSILLLAMAGVVLLIASLNVANMMLARGTARRKEIAIRMALGATRRGILAQLSTEGLMLSMLGGIVGLAVSYWSTKLLIGSLAHVAPIDLAYNAAPDLRVLAMTLGFCVVSTVVFSLAPAWNLSKPDLVTDLKTASGDSGAGHGSKIFSRRNILVMGQLALSLMLLSAAGLFIRSSMRTAALSPGFSIDNRILAEIDPSMAGYDETRGRQFYQTLLGRVRAIPGVESAELAATVPFGIINLGRTVKRENDSVSCGFNIVGPEYFKTLDVPLLQGRTFTNNEGKSQVVVVDKMAAAKLFPNGNAIGQHIRMIAGNADQTPRDAEIVGIVGDVQDHIIGGAPQPRIYASFAQEYQSNMTIHVHASDPGVLEAVRREVRTVDAQVPLLTLRTLRGHLDASFDLWVAKTAARMFSIFGCVALLLASIGLYAVRAYAVAQRTREIGIRMAIGASSRDAMHMVLREGLVLAAISGGAGLLLSIALGRALSGMLYQVSGADPLVFAGAPLLLAAISLLACYFPARRASRVDPMVALRYE